MSERRDQEELLSSFVDGELSQRQAEEIQGLADQDPAVRQRINELKNLQGLLRALPRLEVPPGLSDELKAQLTRTANVAKRHVVPMSVPEPRHVIFRRVRAVAALVAIVIALSSVIHWTRNSSDPGRPSAGRLEVSPTVPFGPAGSGGLMARLELNVASFSTVDGVMMVLNRAIEYSGLSPYTDKKVEGREKVYHIRSSRQAVTAFLEDISPAWSQFERVSLRLATEDFSHPLLLERVSAVQIQQIFQRETAGQGVELARRLAVQNSMERLRVADRLEELTHEHLDLIATRVPNPMLTSRKSVMSPPTDSSLAGGEVIELTIVLRPGKD